MRLLTLLPDFGADSSYPAAMKAVVAARADAIFLDISHDIVRHDIRRAAFMLASIVRDCPAGTVHLAVIDPGVGTARDPVALTLPQGGWSEGDLQGEVLFVDRFGNLITSIPNETIGADAAFQLQTGDGPRRLRVRPAYGMGEPGELLLVAGSDGTLEIALREGDAAAVTGLRTGAPVRLLPEDAAAPPRSEGGAPA